MFPKCFLFLIVDFSICWPRSVLPFGLKQTSQGTTYDKNAGQPLMLTPLIEANNTEKAQNLSSVVPFVHNSGIVSYSGYLTVNKTYNSNLFFWFFRKNGCDWITAPLLLWLQGGPGASSLIGLFNENGPYEYTKAGLRLRNISWTNDYNVLYIDQPVGTGFSFTDSPHGYISTQEEVADHLYEALIQFFQLFPELSKNAFYITGESYAGKYIPAISYKIHVMKEANLTDINLRGLFIVSAITDGLLTGLTDFCFKIGLFDSKTKSKLRETEELIELSIRSKVWKLGTRTADNLLDRIVDSSNISLFDYRKHVLSDMDLYDYIEFLQLSDTRYKIHVGSKAYYNVSEKVFKHFSDDRAQSVSQWIEALLNHAYSIAFVGGQFDVRAAHPLVENFLKKLEWFGPLLFRKSAKKERFFVDGVNAGHYTASGPLTNLLIQGAGHMVPKDQPRATLVALHRLVNDSFFNNTRSAGIFGMLGKTIKLHDFR